MHKRNIDIHKEIQLGYSRELGKKILPQEIFKKFYKSNLSTKDNEVKLSRDSSQRNLWQKEIKCLENSITLKELYK